MNKQDYFIPENEVPGSMKEHLSSSGKYKLIISSFTTKSGNWNYSQGKILSSDSDVPIAIIQRNYGSFPFTWVENHPKGTFLICGEDYQGQTVVHLESGKKVNNLSHGADKGFGFCWADYKYYPEKQLLVVNGCYWAAPYEFKIFDFSDPMEKGWKEISSTTHWMDAGNKWPEISKDGIVKAYEMEYQEEPDDDEPPLPKSKIKSIQTFQIENENLKFVNEWVSDEEKESRKQQKINSDKYKAWKDNFFATDPLYLAMIKETQDEKFNTADKTVGMGQTYEAWCPYQPDLKEARCCKRVLYNYKVRESEYTVDLEWGVEKGPVKLVMFKDHKTLETKFFDHSVEGIKEALKLEDIFGVKK